MSRIKKKNPPIGYPYQLYQILTPDNNRKYAVGATLDQVRRQIPGKAAPVLVNSIVKDVGHSQTHQMLKEFGKSWICRDGQVFFSRESDV